MKPTHILTKTTAIEISIRQAINEELKKSTSFEKNGVKYCGTVLSASVAIISCSLDSYDPEEKTGHIDGTFEAELQITQATQADGEFCETITHHSSKESSFSAEIKTGKVTKITFETTIKLL